MQPISTIEPIKLFTLKTQLECTSTSVGLSQSTNISSIFTPLTIDGKRAILLTFKLSMARVQFSGHQYGAESVCRDCRLTLSIFLRENTIEIIDIECVLGNLACA